MVEEAVICIFILKSVSGVSISFIVHLLFLPFLTFQDLACWAKYKGHLVFWSYLIIFCAPYSILTKFFHSYSLLWQLPKQKISTEKEAGVGCSFAVGSQAAILNIELGSEGWAEEPAELGRLSCRGLNRVLVGYNLRCSAAWTQPYCIQVKNGYFCTAILHTPSFGV